MRIMFLVLFLAGCTGTSREMAGQKTWECAQHGMNTKIRCVGESLEFLDDLDADVFEVGKEKEANDFAYEALTPSSEWATSLARFLATPESVREQAKAWGINPAIVAGRIRQEQENYLILNELVGNGEVRKLFPNINFSA